MSRKALSLVAAEIMAVLSLGSGTESIAANPVQTLKPLTWAVAYTGDLWTNTRGGLKTGSAYLDNLDVSLALDASVWGKPQLTGNFYLLYNNAATFSERYVGDALAISNIDAPEALRLYEAWLQWQFSDALNLRMGLYDLNSEFDVADSRGLFIGSTHGIGIDFSQSGLNGPSIFPATAFALRLGGERGDWNWRLAVLDAVPGNPDRPEQTAIRISDEEGALLVGEVGHRWGERVSAFVGVWNYTEQFEEWTDGQGKVEFSNGNRGAYFGAEAQLGTGGQVTGFVRYGVAEARHNQFDQSLAMGLNASARFAGRTQDRIGIAIARASASGAMRRAFALQAEPLNRSETVIELTWRAPINHWLTLQPDLQWVINPGLIPERENALALGLRFEIDATEF